VELTEAALAQIERFNPALNAFITVTAEEARRQAARAEQEIRRGRCRGPLHGIPLSLKDNIQTRGIRTTAGSKVLADFIPEEDAFIVRKLRRAGAVLVGKTNLHEFAYGVTTNNPHYGPARNPWDAERIPGGSSGGAAVAVATGMCVAAVGSDTGGSIRIPAALCGVVGLKPTFGRVSCRGVVPLAPSLDHVGPLARCVGDTAIVLQAIAGYDPQDTQSAKQAVPDFRGGLRRLGRRVRLGLPREYFFERLEKEVHRAVQAARACLEKLGAQVEEISLPLIGESVEPSTQMAFAEALHVHQSAGWYPARKDDYSEELRRRLEAGVEIRAADYLRAFDAQKMVRDDFVQAFERVDTILAPTTPMAASRVGENSVTIDGEEETVRSALIRLNRPANFTGLPAISLPCGFTRAGLPVGLQLIGPAFGEARLLQIARLYEQAGGWIDRRPPAVR
jgi:aspartyl-tRNA(Asn)/glutamyl-tRNA(Gln) amidotransferase subunit A